MNLAIECWPAPASPRTGDASRGKAARLPTPPTLWRLSGFMGALAAIASLFAVTPPADAQQLDDRYWSVDGEVRAIAATEQKIYIGGSFAHVYPNTGGGAPIDPVDGHARPGFPRIDGLVIIAVSDGSGGWFIGGEFTAVGGLPRANLAHILSSLAVDGWNPSTNGLVSAIAVTATRVYVGGAFSSVNGTARSNIAGLKRATGVLSDWDPDADGPVNALLVDRFGKVYAGGNFSHLGGVARANLAAISPSDAAATDSLGDPDAGVRTLAIGGLAANILFVGGDFRTLGGAFRSGCGAIDLTTGAIAPWDPQLGGIVQVRAIAVAGSTLYLGGRFQDFTGGNLVAVDVNAGFPLPWSPQIGFESLDPPDGEGIWALAVRSGTVYASGVFVAVGGQPRNGLAGISAASAQVTSWDPDPQGQVTTLSFSGTSMFAGGFVTSIGAFARANVAALDRGTGAPTPWNPGANGPVNALAVGRAAIFAGGRFASIGGLPRANLAALDTLTGASLAWDAGTDGEVSAIGLGPGTVYVGGHFNVVGGLPRVGLAAVDDSLASISGWDALSNGPVQAIGVDQGTVYVGGAFSRIGSQQRYGIAALDGATARATTWNPGQVDETYVALSLDAGKVFASGSQADPFLGPFLRMLGIDASTGSVVDTFVEPDLVNALAVQGARLFMGGNSFLDAVDVASGRRLPWTGFGGSAKTLLVRATQLYLGGNFFLDPQRGLTHEGFAAFSGVPRISAPGGIESGGAGSIVRVGDGVPRDDTSSVSKPVFRTGTSAEAVSPTVLTRDGIELAAEILGTPLKAANPWWVSPCWESRKKFPPK